MTSPSRQALKIHRSKWNRRNRTRALMGFLDLVAICLILLIFGLIYVLVPPYHQGFFCDDRTIMKPYREDTVPMWTVTIYAGVLPVILIVFIEFAAYQPLFPWVKYRKHAIDYVRSLFHAVCLFGLGIGATFLLTEVAKRSYGRLRPHFFNVCRPDWTKIRCYDRVSVGTGKSMLIPRYITEYTCLGTDLARIKEARISFPSGHSSIVCFSYCFLLVYIESRLFCMSMRFLKAVLECVFVCVMFFTCLSRITDHKHHYSDVLGGAAIGAAVAFFITLRVATVFGARSNAASNGRHYSRSTQCDGNLMYQYSDERKALGTAQQRAIGDRSDTDADNYDNLFNFYERR